ncbi:MAG: class II fructose-bisphosphate aldolase [Lachnospiraceae bacterium]
MKENLFLTILEDAKTKGIAVGAVNIFNYLTIDAAISAASKAGKNIIIQTSAGTVKHYGVKKMLGMVHAIRDCSEVKVALHLDHCREKALGKECADAGWDGIMMDFSHLSLEENIHNTKEMVEYAHLRGVAVEGEIGVISGVEEDIISETAVHAGYQDTVKFINLTGVDAIAPSIGTAHGVYREAPELNFELVEQLGKLETPVVIHGGSGLSADTFSKLIKLGGRKVNISTVVKNTYLNKLKELVLSREFVTPLEFDTAVKRAVEDEIKKHLIVFGNK